jgi:hypothetical protein
MKKEIENSVLDELASEIINSNMKLSDISSKYQERCGQSITNDKIYDYMFFKQKRIKNKNNASNYWIDSGELTEEGYNEYMKYFKHTKKQSEVPGQLSAFDTSEENTPNKPEIGNKTDDDSSIPDSKNSPKPEEKNSNLGDKNNTKSTPESDTPRSHNVPEEPPKDSTADYSMNKELLEILKGIDIKFIKLDNMLTAMHDSMCSLIDIIAENRNRLLPKHEPSQALFDEMIKINNSKGIKISVSINEALYMNLKTYINDKHNINSNDARIIEAAIIELLYKNYDR